MFRPLKTYQLVVDIAIGLVFFALVFAFRDGPTVVGVLGVGFGVALGFRRASPPISLGVAWVTAILQMFALHLQPGIADFAILAVLYATAMYGTFVVRRV